MAKKKKKKSKSKFNWKRFFGLEKKKGGKKKRHHTLKGIFKVLVVFIILAGLAFGFITIQRYVKKRSAVNKKTALLKLKDFPIWVNETLKQRVMQAAFKNGENLVIDEGLAESVYKNITSEIAWVKNVQCQTTNDYLVITADWIKPVAIIHHGMKKYYVSKDLIILDYLPLKGFPIVEVKGIYNVTKSPKPGKVWRKDDLKAAIEILVKLNQMDKALYPNDPLLYEIDNIDVTNFDGRKNAGSPHIIMYAKDSTKIIWGAEYGTWQRHMEVPDEEKLTKLYGFYEEFGTLQGLARQIRLHEPQNDIPLPTDRYSN